MFTTAVVSGRDAVWDETFSFRLDAEPFGALRLAVLDKGQFVNQVVGSVQLSVTELMRRISATTDAAIEETVVLEPNRTSMLRLLFRFTADPSWQPGILLLRSLSVLEHSTSNDSDEPALQRAGSSVELQYASSVLHSQHGVPCAWHCTLDHAVSLYEPPVGALTVALQRSHSAQPAGGLAAATSVLKRALAVVTTRRSDRHAKPLPVDIAATIERCRTAPSRIARIELWDASGMHTLVGVAELDVDDVVKRCAMHATRQSIEQLELCCPLDAAIVPRAAHVMGRVPQGSVVAFDGSVAVSNGGSAAHITGSAGQRPAELRRRWVELLCEGDADAKGLLRVTGIKAGVFDEDDMLNFRPYVQARAPNQRLATF